MYDINLLIDMFKDMHLGNAVSDDLISDSERRLNLKFSNEYKLYLRKYGVVSLSGHEFTGLIEAKRLNVVACTLDLRSKKPDLPGNFYVIEDLGIDSLFACQTEKGTVYLVSSELSEMKKVAESIGDYLFKS